MEIEFEFEFERIPEIKGGSKPVVGKNYEINSDYILDVLEDAASESVNKIFDKIEGDLRHEFLKLLAILDEIEKINIKKKA